MYKEQNNNIKIELAVLLLFNLVCFVVFAHYDTLELIYQFSRQHEEYELDEVIPLFVTLCLSLGFFSFRRWQDVRSLVKTTQQQALTDPLTQLCNRRAFDEIISSEKARFERHKEAFSLLIIDLDDFKSVNDKYGHQVGDQVLICVTYLLKKHCRKSDYICRWGGEEFLILCPKTNLEQVKKLADHLQVALNYPINEDRNISASIGIAEIHPNESLETLLKRTDNALYTAKAKGKNTIVYADLPVPSRI
ncbi:GGDEF domain-containing protein [Catenovulum sp. SM1970]|uniref:GGDEF domain-containing protein n=1 Tax=Marinifaba aquimaris TaxID=2741323 RepID=UPI001572487E|nr:GGDEF domain-containing protein [Marinifaba aquimaris]NTS78556.1 GGDEF domain-containing protein [Marinifaba aquimaris]